MKDFPYGRLIPWPGKRAFLSPKKAMVPFYPRGASAVINPAIPFPRGFFAERKQDGQKKIAPGPFCLRRLLFCLGNEKNGMSKQGSMMWSKHKKSFI
jgi:hypothetical protein